MSTRRSIFKVFAGAVCAAAMEVTGLRVLEHVPAQISSEELNTLYTEIYLWHPDALKGLTPDGVSLKPSPRYKFENGQYREIPWAGVASTHMVDPDYVDVTPEKADKSTFQFWIK